MKPGLFAAVVVASFLLGFGVGRTSASPTAISTAASASSPVLPAEGARPSMPSLGMEQDVAPASGGVSGTVAEVIQVPNYTYLRLTTAQGEEWAAVTSTEAVKTGDAVSITNATPMADFTSNTLKRTFASIWFGQLAAPGAATGAPAATGQKPSGSGFLKPVSGATAGAMAAIQKADGPLGLRVADVFSERAALSGKNVKVRGLVTKVNAVQGINYVHVKDGSGTGTAGDDDLTIMTVAQMKVDDVVTIEGRVAVDKDLGMGVKPVVLEEAKLVGN